MPGTSLPRTYEEWQKQVNRQLSESRRGAISLVGGIREQVEVIEANTRRTPTNPVEITYQTSFYTAYTQASGLNVPYTAVRLSVDFPDVTKATDGTDITVDRYELWGFDATPNIFEITTSAVPGKAVPGMTVPGLVKTDANVAKVDFAKPTLRLIASSSTSSFRAEDFIPGRTYTFYVRAMTLGEIQPGKLSAPFTVVMGKDTTPPPQPTAPVVVSERGQLIVTWNGQAVSGAMPADFTHAVLTMGTETSPEKEIARFGRTGGTYVAAAQSYYEVLFFRLRAYDETGNASAWSEQAFGYPEPLVDTDIILSTLDAAKTHLKNVNAKVSILENTIIAEHLVATEAMSAKIGQFLYLKAGQIDVNDLWADNAFVGYAEAKLIRADMFIGKAFEGGTFTLTQGGKFQTTTFDNRGVKVTSAGIQAWNPVGTMTYDMQASTGDVVATGTFYTDLTGSRVRIGDRNNIAAIDLWADDTVVHGALFVFKNMSNEYATQITHFNDVDNITPSSFIQLFDDSWNMTVGDYGAPIFAQMNLNGFTVQHPTGYLQTNSGDYYMLHNGSSSGGSSPHIRLTESQRRIILSTGTLSGDANNYGYLQVTPTSFFARQKESNYIDLTATYFTARVGSNNNYINVGDDTFELKMAKGHRYVAYTNGNWDLGSSVNIDSSGRGRIIGGLDELVFYPSGSGTSGFNYLWLRYNTPSQITGGFNVYGNFNCFNGTKNFVMPHPTRIGMELIHAATESPYSGIEYWGEGKLNEDGFWIVELPEYFEPIAAKDHRLVKVFSPSGATLTWTEIMDGQFMVEGPAGAPFGWEVKARREGYDVEVERWVDDHRNAGEPRVHEVVAGEAIEIEDRTDFAKPAVADNVKEKPDSSKGDGKNHGSKSASRNRDFGKATSLRDYQLSRAGGVPK